MTTTVDAFRSDFNADAEFQSASPFRADILWRDDAGDNVLWLMNNDTPSTIATLPFVPPDWHVKATANLEPAGISSDILWQNDNGAVALWRMNGTTVLNIQTLPNPGPTWHVVGANDFNGDTGGDIFFQNDNGSVAMWTMASGGTISGMLAGTQNPGPTWHVVGTGDTNIDGKAGILWQNDNGALALWENPTFGAGTVTFNTVAALPTVTAPSWHVKGMADLDHDDFRSEIVFQNDNGVVGVWKLGGADGTTLIATQLININPGPSWHIVGLRDMNGDQRADILFQNDNGAAAVWEDYQSLGGLVATFNTVLPITPNPNPNGLVWDLL